MPMKNPPQAPEATSLDRSTARLMPDGRYGRRQIPTCHLASNARAVTGTRATLETSKYYVCITYRFNNLLHRGSSHSALPDNENTNVQCKKNRRAPLAC